MDDERLKEVRNIGSDYFDELLERIQDDFMFELSKQEVMNLRSQIMTSRWGGTRYSPMAFTEQGVAMLSSIHALYLYITKPESHHVLQEIFSFR